jgi:hypothetical protein
MYYACSSLALRNINITLIAAVERRRKKEKKKRKRRRKEEEEGGDLRLFYLCEERIFTRVLLFDTTIKIHQKM